MREPSTLLEFKRIYFNQTVYWTHLTDELRQHPFKKKVVYRTVLITTISWSQQFLWWNDFFIRRPLFSVIILTYIILFYSFYFKNFRLSELVSVRLRDNNPNITDLGDKYRPTKLAEMFSELYDNEWTDAFSLMEKRCTADINIIMFLLDIVMVTFYVELKYKLYFSNNRKENFNSKNENSNYSTVKRQYTGFWSFSLVKTTEAALCDSHQQL